MDEQKQVSVEDVLEICAELEAAGPTDYDDAILNIHPRLLLTIASEVLRLRAIGPSWMRHEHLLRLLGDAHVAADEYLLRALAAEAECQRLESELSRDADSR